MQLVADNKKPKRKELIRLEAARLFRENGYLATSMRDLADAVGLEVSSLYSHIKSKEELLQRICFDCADRFLQGLQRIQQSGHSPRKQLRSIIQLHAQIARQDPTAIIVFNEEWRHLSGDHLDTFLRMRRTYEDGILAMIRTGMQVGELRQADPQIAMSTILSGTQWLYRSAQLAQRDLPTVVDQMTILLLNGLEAPNTQTIET